MDHDEALRTQASEKYLLGEFSELERDQFEEHFFSCPQCAEELRAGAIFEANARAVFVDEARLSRKIERSVQVGRRVFWWEWLRLRPSLATSWIVALLFVIPSTYLAFIVVPDLRTRLQEATAPQPASVLTLTAATRGEDRAFRVPEANRIVLMPDLPPNSVFPSYLCEIWTGSGSHQLLARTIPSSGSSELPFTVDIPRSSLPPGQYMLKLYGLAEASDSKREIGTYRFVIQRD